MGSLGVVLERSSLMDGSLKNDFEGGGTSVGVVSEHDGSGGGEREEGPISNS